MLEYNKPLEIKDYEGNIAYTIKNLTLDAELELELMGRHIELAKAKLHRSGRFYKLNSIDMRDRFEYLTLIDVKERNEKQEERFLFLQKRMEEIQAEKEKLALPEMMDIDIIKEIRDTDPNWLADMVKWLIDNIEGYEKKSYSESVRELVQISNAYSFFMLSLKKK